MFTWHPILRYFGHCYNVLSQDLCFNWLVFSNFVHLFFTARGGLWLWFHLQMLWHAHSFVCLFFLLFWFKIWSLISDWLSVEGGLSGCKTQKSAASAPAFCAAAQCGPTNKQTILIPVFYKMSQFCKFCESCYNSDSRDFLPCVINH